jgi:hypothetical protein
MATFKNTQKSPDNGQGWRLVSEHESGKRWKVFGNTWKGFQNLSTINRGHYFDNVKLPFSENHVEPTPRFIGVLQIFTPHLPFQYC